MLLTIGGISFALFLYWDSRRASSPVIPIRAMIERTVASAQSGFFWSSAANVTVIFYSPIYRQREKVGFASFRRQPALHRIQL